MVPVPVIVLSGRAGSGDKIGALDAGADDYVTKPFAMEELLARLRAAAAARRAAVQPGRLSIGRCKIDLAPGPWSGARLVRGPTRGRARLAGACAAHPYRVADAGTPAALPRPAGQLRLGCWPTVWGPGIERSAHYLRFHMAGLRRKLEDDPPRPRHLLTEPGMGYRYQP